MPLVSDVLWQGWRKFHAIPKVRGEKQSDRQIFRALRTTGAITGMRAVAKWSSSQPGCLSLPVTITLIGALVAKAFSCTYGTPLAECIWQNTKREEVK
jgi:hypothetical protein